MSCGDGNCGCGFGELVQLQSPEQKKKKGEKTGNLGTKNKKIGY